jgi:group I intron endonuclease
MPPRYRSGVYSFKNKLDGKRYIGTSVDLEKRKRQHLRGLRRNKHENSRLQNAWNKYGEDNFEYEVLQRCPKVECVEWEAAWILIFETTDRDKGYNICPHGTCKLGTKFSDEAKAKMSAAQKRRLENPDTREEMLSRLRKGPLSNIGKKRSKETRKKISDAHKGKVVSEETKQKLRDHFQKTGGFSEEAVANRLKALASPEIRAKLSAAHKGVPLSEKHLESIRKSRTPEVSKKISDSLKAYNKRKRDERDGKTDN